MTQRDEKRLEAVPVAELRQARKSYGEVTALDGVDLALESGRVTALLGPNGAGKTTAVKLLLGLLRPDAGRVRLFGTAPDDPAARARVGAMLQIAAVPETLKVREHLELFSSYYPSPLPAADVLSLAGLEGLEERLYGKLSGGQQQRLLFALAICGDPDLLFLDEPTVGLDVEGRRALWGTIRRFAESGRSVLLTTHYLEEADALSDRVVVIDGGRLIADGTPAQIKARASSQRIRCVTSLSVETLAGLPGVRDVRADRERIEIVTGQAEAVARELLLRDPGLRGLEITGAGLEEAFLHLTGDGAGGAEAGAA